MKFENLTSSDARRILNALGTGSAPAEFARLLLVGQQQWFDAAIQKMSETGADEDFEVRFVRARYGGGKTHFLYCIEKESKDRNWATSFVLLKRDVVELDRLSTFVRDVARNVVLPDEKVGIAALVEKAFSVHSSHYGICPGKTVSLMAIDRAEHALGDFCVKHFVSPPFLMAVRAGYAAYLNSEWSQVQRIQDWLSGSNNPAVIDARYAGGGSAAKLKPLGDNLAEEHLRLIALLVRVAELEGLFIGVDELEIIGRLPDKRKANSFQTLRALVDQNNPRRQPPSTCLYLAATPEMFEDRDKFPSYKALQDRIESLPDLGGRMGINYRANVIDLDRTQLEREDLLALAQSILRLHKLAFGSAPAEWAHKLGNLVDQIVNGKYLMARPRLLCRCVIDLINGGLSGDMSLAIATRAKQLQEIHEKELSGR